MSTWMVVEDEPDIYAVLLAMFQVWGIEGAAFVDGTEALSWIEDVDAGRVKGDLPELAILDIRLPGASGSQVAAALRRSPILKDIAIVLITAYRLQPNEEDAVMAEAQADLLLYKPLPLSDEFRRVLEDALARRAALATPEPEETVAPEEALLDEGEAEELVEIEEAVTEEFMVDFLPAEDSDLPDISEMYVDVPPEEQPTEPVDTGSNADIVEHDPPLS